jgi:hypothetical protein
MSAFNAFFGKKTAVLNVAYLSYIALCAASLFIDVMFTSLLVVLPLLVGVIIMILKQPKWIVLATFGSLYVGNLFYLVPSESFPVTLFKVSLIGVILVFIFNLIQKKQLKIDVTGLEIEIVLLASFIAISLAWTPAPMDGAFQAIRFIVSLTMCFAVLNLIEDRKTVQQVFLFIGLASIFVAILSVRDLMSNPYAAVQAYLSGGSKVGDRATVVDDDPNMVAALFFLPAFFGASLYSNKKADTKLQLFGGLVVAACLAGSLATLSRSGLLSLGIGIAIISFKMRSQRLIVTGIIGAILVLALKPDLILTLTNLVRRFAGLLTGEVDTSASLRVNLLIASWEMFVNSAFLGIGFRGFGPTYLATHYVSSAAPVYEPHNMTYTVYTELGLHGLLLVTWIVIYTFKTARENVRICELTNENPAILAASHSVFASLIAYMIFFQFLSGAYNNSLFLLCCTLPFIIRKVIRVSN